VDIFIWGAQLEQSTTVGEYVKTTSTINSAPRFNHDPTTGESLGLLVEEARTNSIRNNTMVGAVAGTPGTLPTNWSGTLAVNGLTAVIAGVGVENGISYIDYSVTGTTTGAGAALISFDSPVAATTSQAWALSSYVRLLAGSFPASDLTLDLALRETDSGAAFLRQSLSTLTTASSQFTRTALLATTGASTAFVTPAIRISTTSTATAVDFTLRIGLPQLEQGAFATSVIPTTTAAVTRAADVAGIYGDNFSSWYRQDEGTVFVDGVSRDSGVALLTISDGTTNNRIQVETGTNTRFTRIVTGGVLQSGSAIAYTYGSRQKYATAYMSNSVISANAGVLTTEDTSAIIPTVDRLQIGTNVAGGGSVNNAIGRLLFWPQRLPNETLQTITQ